MAHLEQVMIINELDPKKVAQNMEQIWNKWHKSGTKFIFC